MTAPPPTDAGLISERQHIIVNCPPADQERAFAALQWAIREGLSEPKVGWGWGVTRDGRKFFARRTKRGFSITSSLSAQEQSKP